MEFKDIAAARLSNQRFSDSTFSNACQVVSWFGAIQGQEYALTKWGVGLRAPRLLDNDVETALVEGRILRTHLLRPTWHFVADKDIRWMLKLTAPTVHQASAFMYRSLALDKKLFTRCNKVFEKVLSGKSLTREALNAELKKSRVNASGPTLAYIFMNAELEGVICSGPRAGKHQTYALLDERVKPSPLISRDEALHALTKTYFTSRGPATVHDFSMWSGLKIVDCKKGIGLAGDVLAAETIDNQIYYGPPETSKNGERDDMYLLPIYDEMIMGYKDRSSLFQYAKKFAPSVDLNFNSMILYKGQVIGTWRRNDSGAIKTQFKFFKPLDKLQKSAFNKAFKRLEQFSQREVQKTVT